MKGNKGGHNETLKHDGKCLTKRGSSSVVRSYISLDGKNGETAASSFCWFCLWFGWFCWRFGWYCSRFWLDPRKKEGGEGRGGFCHGVGGSAQGPFKLTTSSSDVVVTQIVSHFRLVFLTAVLLGDSTGERILCERGRPFHACA